MINNSHPLSPNITYFVPCCHHFVKSKPHFPSSHALWPAFTFPTIPHHFLHSYPLSITSLHSNFLHLFSLLKTPLEASKSSIKTHLPLKEIQHKNAKAYELIMAKKNQAPYLAWETTSTSIPVSKLLFSPSSFILLLLLNVFIDG